MNEFELLQKLKQESQTVPDLFDSIMSSAQDQGIIKSKNVSGKGASRIVKEGSKLTSKIVLGIAALAVTAGIGAVVAIGLNVGNDVQQDSPTIEIPSDTTGDNSGNTPDDTTGDNSGNTPDDTTGNNPSNTPDDTTGNNPGNTPGEIPDEDDNVEDTEGLVYQLSRDGTYYIVVDSGDVTAPQIKIPAVHDGKPVSAIFTNAFASSSTTLESIIIPYSVTDIRSEAFSACKKLESITVASNNPVYSSKNNCLIETESKTLVAGCKNSVIPSDGSVTKIGQAAFVNCTQLVSIVIPDCVTKIESFAFSGCTGLESITAAKDNPVYHSQNNCLIETESRTLAVGCKNSVIPSDRSVTKIGDFAFMDCTPLKSIVIPDCVTEFGRSAFSGCESLESIKIPDGATTISEGMFYLCSSLKSITIPDGVTYIGDQAFYRCASLVKAPIGNNLTYIGSTAFYGCVEFTSIVIPKSATFIGKNAFMNCSNLTSIYFENKEGWYATKYYDKNPEDNVEIDIGDALSDPSTAAQYIKEYVYYREYDWRFLGSSTPGGGNQDETPELKPGNLLATLTGDVPLSISDELINIQKNAEVSEKNKQELLNAIENEGVKKILLYDNFCAEINGIYVNYKLTNGNQTLLLYRADGQCVGCLKVDLSANTFSDNFNRTDSSLLALYSWDYGNVQTHIDIYSDGSFVCTRTLYVYSYVVAGMTGGYKVSDDNKVLTLYFYDKELKFTVSEKMAYGDYWLTLIEE